MKQLFTVPLLAFCVSAAWADSPTDTTAPRFADVSLSNSVIDVSSGSITQTVTARLIDDLSGTYYGFLDFYNSTTNTHLPSVGFGSYNLQSGSALDGIYSTSFTVSQYTPAGTYYATTSTQDNAGNYQYLPGTQSGISFTVGSSIADTTAPRFADVSLSNSVIDVSSGSITQTVTARLIDDLSGTYYGFLDFYNSTTNTHLPSVGFGSYNLQSGSALDGIYSTSFTVSQYTPAGTYYATTSTQDNAGNYQYLPGTQSGISFTVGSSANVDSPGTVALLASALTALIGSLKRRRRGR